MEIGSVAIGTERVIAAEGGDTRVTSIVGASPADRDLIESGGANGPQAFSVYFPRAGIRAGAHFHPVDQYQVFIKGSGRLGSNTVQPVAVHYADRFTPYGPIVAESEIGLLYLTLRMSPHSGVRSMPECRDERRELGGRHVMRDLDVGALTESTRFDLIEEEADGLCASVVRLPSGTSVTSEVEPSIGGQHILALEGEFVHNGEAYPAPSVAVCGPGERPVDLRAGEQGMVMLNLIFPDPARPPRRERKVPRVNGAR